MIIIILMTTNEEFLQIEQNADEFILNRCGRDVVIATPFGEMTAEEAYEAEADMRGEDEIRQAPQLLRAALWARLYKRAEALPEAYCDLLEIEVPNIRGH